MADPPDPAGAQLAELVAAASFVFRGTVQAVGASNVRGLEPDPRLLLARVEVPLRSDPAIGDPTGRVVTVSTVEPERLSPGDEAVFFTTGWIHGEEIAVRELAHTASESIDAVRNEVARLPDRHLQERLSAARLVVLAEVLSTARLKRGLERRSPRWGRAELRVLTAVKGRAREPVLYFPTSDSHHWFRAKRPRKGQRRVFLLHAEDEHARHWLDEEERGAVFTALDPADIQPEAELVHIRALLRELRA